MNLFKTPIRASITVAVTKTQPRVSIVMPTYNQSAYIREAVESIIAQTHRNWELVIVDDGSTDGTAEYLATVHDARITVLRKKNGGTGSALNDGFRRVSGEYETWWASDNVMLPDMLSTLVAELEKGDADYVYGGTEIRVFEQGRVVRTKDVREEVGSMEWNAERFRKNYFLGICWMWRRSFRVKAGDFQKEPCEDYDMVLRMMEEGCRFKHVPPVLGWFRRHQENMSNKIRREFPAGHFDRLLKAKAEARAAQRKASGSLNILHVNLEIDCAGVSWNLCQAINAHTQHRARHVVRCKTFAAPNTDLEFSRVAQIMEWVEWADVLHFNNWIWTHRPEYKTPWYAGNEYGEGNPFENALKKKRIVFHFHGGAHQLTPDYWIRECRRVGAAVLKCDPLSPIPGAEWVPNVPDVPHGLSVIEDAPFSVAVYGDEKDPRRNNAQIFEALGCAGIPFKPFAQVPRYECLEQRRAHAVSIDNMTQGFVGMWTWEALAMGSVPVARVAPEAADWYKGTFGDAPPIVSVENVDHLVRRVQALRDDAALLAGAQKAGREWAARCLQPAALAENYIRIYEGRSRA